jgi:CheY-like chemotaxis protein
MSLLILVVDDEPDVEVLFRQRFERDLRAGRFTMEFAQSGPDALQRISDAAGVSLILTGIGRERDSVVETLGQTLRTPSR